MIEKKKIFNATNYEKQKIYVAKANSVTEIQFDMDKNYYRFTNTGALPVYISTSYTPTTQRYDVKVDGNTVSSFNEPTDRDTIYLLNNNNEDITILITSFLAEFDPNFSAMGDMAIEVKGTVETDGIVKGFKCSLPDLSENDKQSISRILSQIEETTNGRLKAYVKDISEKGTKATQLNNVLTKLEAIESKMGSSGGASGGSDFSMFRSKFENRDMSIPYESWSINDFKFKKLVVKDNYFKIGILIPQQGYPSHHIIEIPEGEYENINFFEKIKHAIIDNASNEDGKKPTEENWQTYLGDIKLNYDDMDNTGIAFGNECTLDYIQVY